MLAISGKPYDTLEEVIGLRESPCSLKEYGVGYAQVDLREDGSFDFPAIERALNDKTKLIHIQRSRATAAPDDLGSTPSARPSRSAKSCAPTSSSWSTTATANLSGALEPATSARI